MAATWVIGEYGDALLRGSGTELEGEDRLAPPSESDVVDLFGTILSSSYSGQIVRQYIITAAVKLTTRLSDTTQIERIHSLLRYNQTNLDVEIQQRAVEYGNMFAYTQIMKGVLEKMPAPEIREEQRVLGEAPKKHHGSSKKARKANQITEQDLLGLVGTDEPSSASKGANGSGNNADLLMDLLGGSTSPISQSPPPQQKNNVADIMNLFGSTTSPPPSSAHQQSASSDLLGGLGSSAAPLPSTSPTPSAAHDAYNKNGLHITFQLQRTQQAIQSLVRFRNTGSQRLSSVNLQAAVPKTQKLQLQNITSSDIPIGGEVTQLLRVTGVNGVRLHCFFKSNYEH